VSAQAATAPVAVHRALPAEEAARAHFYALLARLVVAPPDGALLHAIAQAEPLAGPGELASAWQALVDASSVMDADAAAEEHEALFATLGKADVPLYAGYYSGATAVDHPRVRIRADLVALGLAPRPDSTEPEDHLGGLFEAMRVLIAGRNFLLAAGIGGAGAVAVAAGARKAEHAGAKVAQDAPAEQGYRATEHVLKYYKTTEV